MRGLAQVTPPAATCTHFAWSVLSADLTPLPRQRPPARSTPPNSAIGSRAAPLPEAPTAPTPASALSAKLVSRPNGTTGILSTRVPMISLSRQDGTLQDTVEHPRVWSRSSSDRALTPRVPRRAPADRSTPLGSATGCHQAAPAEDVARHHGASNLLGSARPSSRLTSQAHDAGSRNPSRRAVGRVLAVHPVSSLGWVGILPMAQKFLSICSARMEAGGGCHQADRGVRRGPRGA